MVEHFEEDNSTDKEGKERIRAVDNVDKRLKFRNKIKYRKPSTLRRKIKKKYHKFKVPVLVTTFTVAILILIVVTFKTAWDQTKEIEKKNIELKNKKKMEEIERNKKF